MLLSFGIIKDMSHILPYKKELLSSKYTAIFIIIAVSIAVYLNTLSNGFVYDDVDQVLNNHWIKDVNYIREIFFSDAWGFKEEGISNYYRPVMHLIYMAEYHAFNLKSWGFHLINIIFHAGVTILVFFIASMFVNKGFSLIAAILFAAHPIHTEAVAWVGGIPELSFTFFFLFSFYLYAIRDILGRRGIILSLISFLFAALCKETALILPLLLFIYDYSMKGKNIRSLQFFLNNIKSYIPYIILAVLYFILRTYAVGGFIPLRRHPELSTYQYIINIFPLFIQYLEKLILPINLNAFYVLHPLSSILEWKGIITFVLAILFINLFRRTNGAAFFSLSWMLITLLPVLYIPALGENTFAERYLYLPSVGFVMLLSIAIEKVNQFKIAKQFTGVIIVLILTIMVGLYSIGTIKRNHIWRDDYSLWLDTVKKSSDGYIPHNNLGLAYYNKGLVDKAIEHYQIALKLRPNFAEAFNNLGIAYQIRGLLDKAIEHYLTAIILRPDFPEPLYNLGTAYYNKGILDKAIEYYKLALKQRPDHPETHFNLANTLYDKGLADKAAEHYKIALRLKPDYPYIQNNVGLAYYNRKMIEKAIEHYQLALRLRPDFPEAHYNLGLAYYNSGFIEKAIEHYQLALKLQPDFSKAQKELDRILRRRAAKINNERPEFH